MKSKIRIRVKGSNVQIWLPDWVDPNIVPDIQPWQRPYWWPIKMPETMAA